MIVAHKVRLYFVDGLLKSFELVFSDQVTLNQENLFHILLDGKTHVHSFLGLFGVTKAFFGSFALGFITNTHHKLLRDTLFLFLYLWPVIEASGASFGEKKKSTHSFVSLVPDQHLIKLICLIFDKNPELEKVNRKFVSFIYHPNSEELQRIKR